MTGGANATGEENRLAERIPASLSWIYGRAGKTRVITSARKSRVSARSRSRQTSGSSQTRSLTTSATGDLLACRGDTPLGPAKPGARGERENHSSSFGLLFRALS